MMRRALAIVCGLTVLAGAAACRGGEAGADLAAWAQAQAAARGSDQAQAAAAYQAFAAQYPWSDKVPDALAEAAQAHFALGRAAQVLHRNPPPAVAEFTHARDLFRRVAEEYPSSAVAPRAQYMSGSASLFLHDLPAAEREYGAVANEFARDQGYLKKAMVRRAEVLLHQLRVPEAVASFREFAARFPQDTTAADANGKRVLSYLRYASKLDKPAPPLSPSAWIQGEPVVLARLRGRPVAVYFFATWCPHCNGEKEFINDLYARCGAKGWTLVGVTNASRGQTVESVRSWLESNRVRFPVMMDAGAATSTAYDGGSVPNLVLIDRAGNVRWHDHPAALVESTLDLVGK